MGKRRIFFPRKRRFNAKTMMVGALFVSVSMISFVAGLHVGAQYMSPEDAASLFVAKTASVDLKP